MLLHSLERIHKKVISPKLYASTYWISWERKNATENPHWTHVSSVKITKAPHKALGPSGTSSNDKELHAPYSSYLGEGVCTAFIHVRGLRRPPLQPNYSLNQGKTYGWACVCTSTCVQPSLLKLLLFKCSCTAFLNQGFKYLKYFLSPLLGGLDYKSNFSVTQYTPVTFYSKVSSGSYLILFLLNNISSWCFTSQTLMPHLGPLLLTCQINTVKSKAVLYFYCKHWARCIEQSKRIH